MSEVSTTPPAKAPPLFSLDLKENGGLFAPTSLSEISSWIQHEVNFWSWLNGSRAGGSHDQGIRQAINQLNQAQNNANQAQQFKDSNPQHYEGQLQGVRSQLEEAFLRQRLPHSSTPLAKRIEDYRKEAGDHPASFFASVFVPPQQGHHFQPQELVGWRGLVEGLIERYGLTTAPAKGRKQAADQSFEQPLLNFEWVDSVVFGLAAGVKGGRSPAKRTLDAGCQPVRWLSWPMRHADASAMTSRSVSYA